MYGRKDHPHECVNAICKTSRKVRAESIPILAQQCKIIHTSRFEYGLDGAHVGTKLTNLRQSFRENVMIWSGRADNSIRWARRVFPNLRCVLAAPSIRSLTNGPLFDSYTDAMFVDEYSHHMEASDRDGMSDKVRCCAGDQPQDLDLLVYAAWIQFRSSGTPAADVLPDCFWSQYGGRQAVRTNRHEHQESERPYERSEMWRVYIDPIDRTVLWKQHLPMEVRPVNCHGEVIVDRHAQGKLRDWMYDNYL